MPVRSVGLDVHKHHLVATAVDADKNEVTPLRRGMPHEFCSYEGLEHYFSISAGDPTTCNWQSVAWQML